MLKETNMAIKMRNNTDSKAICCECKETQEQVLNMFDLCVGDTILTICDACNEKVLDKCLKAECMKNSRTKSNKDMQIINKRRNNKGEYND